MKNLLLPGAASYNEGEALGHLHFTRQLLGLRDLVQ